MPSTVYKGDLAEVTFGHESGIVLTHSHHANALTWTHATTGDTSVITFGGAHTADMFSGVGVLKYPAGLLVGCNLRIKSTQANYDADDYATTGRLFTIIANSGATITVTPALAGASGSQSGGANDHDTIIIDALGCPTIDTEMGGYNASAAASDETVLTDQFVGLAATLTLPETKVEVLRQHVVGIGRDVVVQVPQKMSNEGGTLDTMMNSARWLYYCLGNEATVDAVDASISGAVVITAGTPHAGAGNALAINMGDNYIQLSGAPSVGVPAVGDYIQVCDATPVAIPSSNAAQATGTLWPASHTSFTRSESNEIRRVIAYDARVGTERRIYVDDPFCFDHAAGCQIMKMEFSATNANGSPHFETGAATYGNIQNRVSRLLFSGWHIPSFSVETSMRSRDVGSYSIESAANVPGSANDSKQLTRIYKGCKVKDWSLTADADAEAKLSINFDALMCYTDTGRLENSNKGDRYTAHRMFENIGNGIQERKEAGIAPNTEKPFMFYNGSITAFGQPMAQVTNFNLTGNNNTVTHYTVRGSPAAETRNTAGDSLEQIPFGGSRNPALIVEGKNEYELSMTVIVDDPLLWHEFRTNRERNDSNPITLTMTKAGPGTAREQMVVIIDEYIIAEAPLQIPDDKGVIKSELKIKPKHVKVVSHDALLHC